MNLETKVEPTKERKDYRSELYRLETAAIAISSYLSGSWRRSEIGVVTEIDEARVKDGLAQSLLDAVSMLRLVSTSHGQKLLRLVLAFQCLKAEPQPYTDRSGDDYEYRADRDRHSRKCRKIKDELFAIAKELVR